MRRVLFAITFALAVLVCGAPCFGQVGPGDDAGALEPAPAETASSESFPLRLGKALAFAVAVSAFLLAGGMLRRGRRKPRSNSRG